MYIKIKAMVISGLLLFVPSTAASPASKHRGEHTTAVKVELSRFERSDCARKIKGSHTVHSGKCEVFTHDFPYFKLKNKSKKHWVDSGYRCKYVLSTPSPLPPLPSCPFVIAHTFLCKAWPSSPTRFASI